MISSILSSSGWTLLPRSVCCPIYNFSLLIFKISLELELHL